MEHGGPGPTGGRMVEAGTAGQGAAGRAEWAGECRKWGAEAWGGREKAR